MVPISIAYVAAVAAGSLLVPDHAAPGIVPVAIATIPGIAVVGWIWAMARLLTELDDEYLRMMEIRKFLIASGFTLALTSIWGLIELFTTVPRIPIFFVWPLWCVGMAVGQVANRMRFGAAGCA